MKGRILFYGGSILLLIFCVLFSTSMPGSSFAGELPASTAQLSELATRLRDHVAVLAGSIGVRDTERPQPLEAARCYIAGQLAASAVEPGQIQFEDLGAAGEHAQNVVFEVPGKELTRTRSVGLVVVGAHYDSIDSGPGANDNGSGVAALLELAAAFAKDSAPLRVRFVFFANEEPPFFQNPGMGSFVHAQRARLRGDRIRAMLSLETIGYYSAAPDSQHYPWPVGLLYPNRADFLAFVGDLGARSLVRASIRTFRAAEPFPSEGVALPTTFPGVDWSDHWAFRKAGYPAVMITDTAVFRDPNYHRASDTPDKLDYERLARVTRGLEAVIRGLAR